MSSSNDLILPIVLKQNSYNTNGNTYVLCDGITGCPPTYPCAKGSISTGSYGCHCDGILASQEFNCTAPDVSCPPVAGFTIGKQYFLDPTNTNLPMDVVCPYHVNPSTLTEGIINNWKNAFPEDQGAYEVLMTNYCTNPSNLSSEFCKSFCESTVCELNYQFYCEGANLNTETCKQYYCFGNGIQKCTTQLATYCVTTGGQAAEVCPCYLGTLFYDVYLDLKTRAITNEKMRSYIIGHLSKLPPSCIYPECSSSPYMPDTMPKCTDNLAICLLKYDLLYDTIFENNTDPQCSAEFTKLYDKYLKPKQKKKQMPPSPSTTITKPAKSNTGLIVGIIGGLIFLAVIGIVLYFVLRKKKHVKKY